MFMIPKTAVQKIVACNIVNLKRMEVKQFVQNVKFVDS